MKKSLGISHADSMKALKKRRPDVYKALKDPEPMACLAWNVMEYRHEKGLSQKALAAKAGVSLRTIAYLEEYRDKFNPQIKIVQAIAKALGVKFTELFQTVDMTKS
ncbi:MAG TPA: helix-turn-helix transcriptional regulator [bacterium]|jgi:DNA-binding XRE family transcriptional regulator|nr:helix-turn-helix transcriptional regulator [bacterium]